ncbi:efflux RND transporter permease subunit [Aneurinibacillus thermoaerophilus]|uniref:efflux RND transporter permease subunit n=1 Tax=Aneurinibacillus thermoaerophilus TaxID=143495 RepID=UPI002E21F74B|nr:efflux RND transporter permease subunit [Aneurinibacillus thermoaerophilus]MED0763453.1 efflux RND transporter permease subunit [Aneurinibacillus thermoaerophilus]
MKIADFSVKRPVTIAMLIVALVIFGVISLPMLKVDLYPELKVPVLAVVISDEGAAPAEVEKLVTKPIEEAVGTVSNVKKVESQSSNGASLVIIQFNWGTDMDQAALDVREKIDSVRGVLPKDAGSPRVLKMDPNSAPIITLAMSGPMDVVELNKIAEDVIKSRIERVEGVASLTISGAKEREIQVILNPDMMDAYGLTIDQINQALSARNLSGTAGNVIEGDKDINLKVTGEFNSPEDIAQTPIYLPQSAGGGVIQLADIATVTDGYKKVSQKSMVNGQPSIGLQVMKATGANTVKTADLVQKELDKIRPLLPKGVKIETILDTSVFIKDSINTVAGHGIEGSIFAIVILFLFLNSFRSTLVIAIVIPISVIATFSLMYFTGQTINLISLSGLLLGLGSLVDFAVVVIESVYRKRQQGLKPDLAAIIGTKEVGTAVMASALAQICVFLPIVFVEGLPKMLFGPLALTVVFSHIAALFAAITLVPMMSSKLLTEMPKEPEDYIHSSSKSPMVLFQKGFYRLSQAYGRLIRWALGHRKTVIFGTIVALVVSIGIFVTPLVGKEFLPSFDEGSLTVNVKLPPGSRLEETENILKKIEKIAASVPEKQLIYTSVGSGGPASASSSSNTGSVELKLVPKEQRTRSTDEVIEEIRDRVKGIPGADITVQATDPGGGGGTGSPIDIAVSGDDLDTLRDLSDTVVELVKGIEGTRNVVSSLDSVNDEIQIKVDSNIASQYGITTGQVLSAVRTAFDGEVATKYRTGDDEIDVRVQFPSHFRDEMNHIDSLMLSTPSGARVSVGQVATITKESVPQKITRSNQTRQVKVTGDVAGRDLGSVIKDINAKLKDLKLPEGYHVTTGGQAEDMADAFSSLSLAILLSIVLVYMVMASQFESLFYPFVIMFSIPPTFIGVVVGLLVTGENLGVMALMGYILLIGIVVNNAIVLIDYVNTLRKEGMQRDEAILVAGPVRLRPIVMTTLATVLAILPLAFGSGEGAEGYAPLAIVVTFGLTFSTLVTLVLIPVVYTLFDDMIQKRKRRRRERREKRRQRREKGTGGEAFNA